MPNLKDVYEVTDVIKGACNPHAIILFGSLSRGDKGNDIDLLIVTNKRDACCYVGWVKRSRPINHIFIYFDGRADASPGAFPVFCKHDTPCSSGLQP